MNDVLTVYYMNERCPTLTVNFRLDLLIKHGLLGEIQKIQGPPNFTLQYCCTCIPEMPVGLHGARRGNLERHKAGAQSIQLWLDTVYKRNEKRC